MKLVLRFGSHLFASLFLFYCIGLSAAFLLIQSQWVDMRFDSEYAVFVSMGVGISFYFLALFMNADKFIWWNKKRVVLPVVAGSLIITGLTTYANGSLLLMPAYITRKAWFLDSAVSLFQMNWILLSWIIIGLISLFFAENRPLAFTKTLSIQWQKFTRSKRIGILLLLFAFWTFLLFYLAQGGFQYYINQAFDVLKAANVETFRDYLLSFGPLAAVVSGLLMVFQSIIAPLPAFVITFANGMIFGWGWGALLSWSSAMLGATLCFFLAKYFGRPFVEKLVSKSALVWTDRFFAHYGKHAIFISRLLPIVSFDLVSYAAGLTSIRFSHFFWATGLGQLPATLLYSYLGQTASGVVKILFLIFTIVTALAIIGVILRPKLKHIGRSRS